MKVLIFFFWEESLKEEKVEKREAGRDDWERCASICLASFF